MNADVINAATEELSVMNSYPDMNNVGEQDLE